MKMKKWELSQLSNPKAARVSYLYENGQIQSPEWVNVAQEVPVALVYNGISHVVMMMTPQDLALFAVGFSLSEQIISAPCEIYGIDIHHQPNGIEIHIELSTRRFVELKARRRALTGRTGCGICGTEQLSEVNQPIPPLPFTQQFSLSHLPSMIAQLNESQAIRAETGCTHAAGWVDQRGLLLASCEDVGRHNALDKLLGMKVEQNWQSGAVFVSSRASYEMVKKAAICGAEILLTMASATALAIDIAEQCRLTLVSACRPHRAIIYTHPQRIVTK